MIYTFTDKEDFGETRVESTLPAKPQSVKTCHKPQLRHTYFNQRDLQPRPRGVAKEKEMKKQKETEKKDEHE